MKSKLIIVTALVSLALLAGCNKTDEATKTATTESAPAAEVAPAPAVEVAPASK